MKVTANLSFLLCIGSVVMPAIDARANGFGLKRSAATKRSIEQRQEVFDFAAHQESRRDLKSPATKRFIKHRKAFDVDVAVAVHPHMQRQSLRTDGDMENVVLDLCEAYLSILVGPDSGCTCDDEFTSECDTYLNENCKLCGTLQGEEACILFDPAETAAVNATDGYVGCLSYESGPFVGTTICEIENVTSNTCVITLDGEECSSCTVIACGDDTDYEFDCSNIVKDEKWNLCTSDIPETSRWFLAGANNDHLTQLDCGYGDLDLASCQSFLDEYDFDCTCDCTCEQDGQDFFPSCDCAFQFCETLQGEEVCVVIDEEAAAAATASASEPSLFADCYTFTSGPLDNTICKLVNLAESTCAITIDGNECNSCAIASCSATNRAGVIDKSFDFDCSNVIAGEAWNLCTDDIPVTSPFIVVGNNELFLDGSCVLDSGGPGGFALSFRALSVVGLLVVAAFW
jgi:hypothetical protein